jgi:hypothetical protein
MDVLTDLRREGTMDVQTELQLTQDRRGGTMVVLTELPLTQDRRGGTMDVPIELPMTQDRRGGTMDVLTELPMTMTRITIVGRECAPLLQQMTNRAGGGPDTVLGAWHLVMIQATTSRISRGPGDADSQSPWTQGPE